MSTNPTPESAKYLASVATLEQLARQLGKRWQFDKSMRTDERAWALAIVDALNLSAKLEKNSERKAEIYVDKSHAIAAAINIGCDAGIGNDDQGNQVLYMYAENIGVVSVHTAYLPEVPPLNPWPYSWCAIRRQRWAAAALEYKEIRQLLAEYTSPPATGKDNAEFVRKAKEIAPYYQYADLEF